MSKKSKVLLLDFKVKIKLKKKNQEEKGNIIDFEGLDILDSELTYTNVTNTILKEMLA